MKYNNFSLFIHFIFTVVQSFTVSRSKHCIVMDLRVIVVFLVAIVCIAAHHMSGYDRPDSYYDTPDGLYDAPDTPDYPDYYYPRNVGRQIQRSVYRPVYPRRRIIRRRFFGWRGEVLDWVNLSTILLWWLLMKSFCFLYFRLAETKCWLSRSVLWLW